MAQSFVDFEAQMSRIQEIVTALETGQETLEKSLALFQEGIALYSACHKALKEAELKVETFRENLETSEILK